MLQINNLLYRVEGRALFQQASATINRGWRVGLVGRNGTGKSTLLKLIMGQLSPDEGSVEIIGRQRIGTVAQEAPGGERSLVDTVLAADTERAALLQEAETATDPTRIAEIHDRLATIRAETAPARAARILAGLGFDEEAQQRPCASFSGGWRMRVALAALLFVEPDILLLDEPTNHLDLEASLWLEGHLASYPGTLLLVSHDRDLLNRAVDRILHLEGRKLTLYGGNYDTFERTRRERLEHEAAQNARIEAQRKHIQTFVDRFRYKASKARQAQSRMKMLEKLQPSVTLVEDASLALNFPAPEPLAPPILQLEQAAVGYEPGRPILRGLNLRLDMDDRIALLGANGNGKSTLARLLAGKLEPQEGACRRDRKLRIGYFAQDQAEALDLSLSAMDNLARHMPEAAAHQLRDHLARFGLGGDRATTKAGDLSGGEKARLLFSIISRNAPHLLILDEPTNHLDIDARDALVQALGAYEGAVVLVSHDPRLVELVADRLWLVQDGRVRSFDGDMNDYRQLLLEQRRAERRELRNEKPKESAPNRKDQRRAAAEIRAATANLRKAAQQAERRLEQLARDRAAVEAELADPELYEKTSARIPQLQKRLGELDKEIAAAEAAWLEAEEAIEAAFAEAGA
ncbi:MAG TPA: ABC-F family ATP-binding cassette domain-containing protein [Kiloniellales bacterium]|nr:ABC-F family ATP-binding cassette domain-containing protein [Kiloniellales bacterium]